jgi:2-polyprenyl-3-methyl-5-hydroxy-6-metoxy-1,4-benzoquinol methylase
MRRVEAQLFDLLALPRDAEVLDVGCDTVHIAIALAKRGLKVAGIDLIEQHLIGARRAIAAAGLDE